MSSAARWLALLSLFGCTAVRYPEPAVSDPVGPVDPPVVAVVPPNVRLDDRQPLAEHELLTYDTSQQIEQAAHVIHALRETGLFQEVDFTCSLSAEPDLAITIQPPPPGTGSFERWWLWFITVGLIPVTETHQKGVYFTAEGEAAFAFDWPVQHIIGWAAIPFHLSPSWHFDQTQARFSDALSAALLRKGWHLFDRTHWLDREEARRMRERCS